LEEFLGKKYSAAMQTELTELGVEEVYDLKEIDIENVKIMPTKFKKAQSVFFVKKVAKLMT